MTTESTSNPAGEVRPEATSGAMSRAMSRATSRATSGATLWAACRTFVPLALVANLSVAAVPHVRGLAFVPQLRYAVITPICAAAALAAAFFFRALGGGASRPGWTASRPRWTASRPRWTASRPRLTLCGALALLAALALALMAVAGPPGLAEQAWVPVLVLAVALALLTPRAFARPSGRVGRALAAGFAGLALLGVGAALAGERVGPPAQEGQNRMAFDIPRSAFDATHRFMELPSGARIHYVDEGQGETLLFLHGNPGWSFQWRELVHALKGSYRCVALDYPGFGLSTAPPGFGYTPQEQRAVIEAFVDRLGLRDLTLVMQDWGGPFGLGFAERRPELVQRLVLGNTWAWPTDTRTPRGTFSKLVGGPVGEFIQMNFNGFTAAALSHDIARPLPPGIATLYRRPFRPLDRRGVAAFYPGQITAAATYFTELEAGLDRLRDRRTLILWGLRDPGFPRADLERHQRAFPNHVTVELPEAGHFFFEDAPEAVVARMRTFLSEGTNQPEQPHEQP